VNAICPSCGRLLNEKHRVRHEIYLIAHRRAVKKYQNKYKKEGKRCYLCGRKLKHYRQMCDRCMVLERLRVRRRHGFKAWAKGGVGRKPFTKVGA
jgi:hypothetical protein